LLTDTTPLSNQNVPLFFFPPFLPALSYCYVGLHMHCSFPSLFLSPEAIFRFVSLVFDCPPSFQVKVQISLEVLSPQHFDSVLRFPPQTLPFPFIVLEVALGRSQFPLMYFSRIFFPLALLKSPPLRFFFCVHVVFAPRFMPDLRTVSPPPPLTSDGPWGFGTEKSWPTSLLQNGFAFSPFFLRVPFRMSQYRLFYLLPPRTVLDFNRV